MEQRFLTTTNSKHQGGRAEREGWGGGVRGKVRIERGKGRIGSG